MEGPQPRRKNGKALWAFRLSLLLERLRPHTYPKPPPALIQEFPQVRTPLRLDLPYYPARSRGGYTFIPWDPYMEEGEELLRNL
ncbi:hypothetical protein [Thermus amyloliquefaciens]|uniref:hypothetical protein n=1 Tax=Thermus amyloliquefaciens TaxID=1449080 RepID=UPI00068D99AB|nr:hypothetical protein [Thermus amyloliquefaciens]